MSVRLQRREAAPREESVRREACARQGAAGGTGGLRGLQVSKVRWE